MKVLTSCALAAAFGFLTFGAETKMKPEELPSAVKSALREQRKGATVLGASSERENGRMTYEVQTRLAGKSRDLTFSGDGSLLEIEEEVDLDSLPMAAKEAIQKRSAGGVIRKVESVTHGSSTSYEADVKSKTGKRQEVAVNADGSARHSD